GKPEHVLSYLDDTSPADLEMMARVYRARAKRLREASGNGRDLATAANIDEVASLFEHLPAAKPFQVETWSTDGATQLMATDFQRLLWLLENDLTACAFLRMTQWDTHIYNTDVQKESSTRFTVLFNKFIEQLDARKNGHGVLSDNTVILI